MFLKEYFEKINFEEKRNQQTAQNYPACKDFIRKTDCYLFLQRIAEGMRSSVPPLLYVTPIMILTYPAGQYTLTKSC